MTNLEKFIETFGVYDKKNDIYLEDCVGFYCKGRKCADCERYRFWEQEYIEPNEALDKLDDIITEQLDKSDNQVECQTLRWVLDKISELIK